MRDYKLVAQRVFQRRDEYLLAKKRKKRLIWKYTAIPVGLCFLVAAGTGYRHFKGNSSDDLRTVEQETTDFSESDDMHETESQTISDSSVPVQTQERTEQTFASTEENGASSATVSESYQSASETVTITATEPTETMTEQTIISEIKATSPSVIQSPSEVIASDTIPEPTVSITEQTEPTTDASASIQPNDYRITVEAFEPTPEQLSNVIQQTIPSNFENNYTTLEQLFQNAGATIACKVLSVVNTIKDDKPYTVYTVEVTDSIYGSFVAGDLLSIVQYGGYMLQEKNVDVVPPCTEPDDTENNEPPSNKPPSSGTQWEPSEVLVEEKLAYSETPVVSQEYVLFISPDNLFDGAYATLNQNEGVFKVNPETGELIRNAEQGEDINSSLSCDTVKQVGEAFVNSTN